MNTRIRSTLILLLFTGVLTAQTSDFNDFLSRARQYQDTYLQKDTVMRMPFIGRQSEVNWYYEVQFEEEQATFLEEVFYEFNQKGHRMICRCGVEKALDQLEQQVSAWSSSSVSINMVYANFQQQYCLTEKVDQPFPPPTKPTTSAPTSAARPTSASG